MKSTRQRIICLDFEGTLAPEIWPMIADATGIEDLRITTREFPDFAALMKKRIEILNAHNLSLKDIVAVAETAEPLEGAAEFMQKLLEKLPKVVICSDMAEELATPLLKKMGSPLFFGHSFVIDDNGMLQGYAFRQDDPKRKLVQAFRHANLDIIAVGDSYNDIPMLEEADAGFLFRSPEKIKSEYPQYKTTDSYVELLQLLTTSI